MSLSVYAEMRPLYLEFPGNNMSQSVVSVVTWKGIPPHRVRTAFDGFPCQKYSQTSVLPLSFVPVSLPRRQVSHQDTYPYTPSKTYDATYQTTTERLQYLEIGRDKVFDLSDLVQCGFCVLVGLRGGHKEDIAICKTNGSCSSANLE